MGERCARYLARGRPIAVDGRLEWREWPAQDGSGRQAIAIVAESIQFLGEPPGDRDAGAVGSQATTATVVAEQPDADEIPF